MAQCEKSAYCVPSLFVTLHQHFWNLHERAGVSIGVLSLSCFPPLRDGVPLSESIITLASTKFSSLYLLSRFSFSLSRFWWSLSRFRCSIPPLYLSIFAFARDRQWLDWDISRLGLGLRGGQHHHHHHHDASSRGMGFVFGYCGMQLRMYGLELLCSPLACFLRPWVARLLGRGDHHYTFS